MGAWLLVNFPNENLAPRPELQRSNFQKNTKIIAPETFIACVYGKKCYIGLVQKFSKECGDYLISFMYPPFNSGNYYWPQIKDECWVIPENILCEIENLDVSLTSKSKYLLKGCDKVKVELEFKKHKID